MNSDGVTRIQADRPRGSPCYRENIVVDTKIQWFKKSLAQLKIMIYEEFHGDDWHIFAAREIECSLDDFNVGSSRPGEDWAGPNQRNQAELVVISKAEDSLQTKQKGSRISYPERVHLYRLILQNKQRMSQIAIDYNVSMSTLYTIKKEMDRPVTKLRLEKPITNRNMINSSKIQKVIKDYLQSTRIPLTTKDISDHIKARIRFAVPERTIRVILAKVLNLRYKKGLARLVDFDEESQKLVKLWFSVKIWKVIDKFDALINIDESPFSRLTKNNYSWIQKRKEQIIKNISFRNSCSLVTAIISTGGVIAAKSLVSVTSNMFIEFVTEMAKFIQEKEGIKSQNCLVILDNASIHRSAMAQESLKIAGFSVAFIPQYTPEMAPIERYFSKLKKTVINKARGKMIDWKSSDSNLLLKEWMQDIQPGIVRRIRATFVKEILNSLDSCW